MSSRPAPETIWKEDPTRIEKAFRALSEAFGPRIRSLSASRVVLEGPLSLVRVELDRCRRGDLALAREAAPAACVASLARFHIDLDMLPRLIRSGSRKGPFDQGQADDQRKKEIVGALRKKKATGIELYDNVYGRTISILGRDEGRWMLRTVHHGVFDRARAGHEIADYVMEGWWK